MVWLKNFRIWVVEISSWPLLLAEAACTFFVSWCELRLFSFLVEAIDVETGDGYRLNQIISVSL